MADDLIDRRAAGLGEVVVVEGGGVTVPRRAGLGKQSMLGKETEPSLFVNICLARVGTKCVGSKRLLMFQTW